MLPLWPDPSSPIPSSPAGSARRAHQRLVATGNRGVSRSGQRAGSRTRPSARPAPLPLPLPPPRPAAARSRRRAAPGSKGAAGSSTTVQPSASPSRAASRRSFPRARRARISRSGASPICARPAGQGRPTPAPSPRHHSTGPSPPARRSATSRIAAVPAISCIPPEAKTASGSAESFALDIPGAPGIPGAPAGPPAPSASPPSIARMRARSAAISKPFRCTVPLIGRICS